MFSYLSGLEDYFLDFQGQVFFPKKVNADLYQFWVKSCNAVDQTAIRASASCQWSYYEKQSLSVKVLT